MKRTIFFLVFSILPLAAFAQQSVIDCTKFRHNADGSWSPKVAVRIQTSTGKIQLAPPASFRAGVPFKGANIGAVLNKECEQEQFQR